VPARGGSAACLVVGQAASRGALDALGLPRTGHWPQPQNAATGIFPVLFIHLYGLAAHDRRRWPPHATIAAPRFLWAAAATRRRHKTTPLATGAIPHPSLPYLS
jgi:hypothetical protein